MSDLLMLKPNGVEFGTPESTVGGLTAVDVGTADGSMVEATVGDTGVAEGTTGLPFSVESAAVMRQLRTAVSDLLRGLPARVRTARDLQKAFGIDVKLSWQAMKLAGPGDAMALVPFVPTPGPMRRFLNAAAGAGVDRQMVDRVTAAYGAFQQLVATHAGDRSTFESMAAGTAGANGPNNEDLQKAAVRLRKAAFLTASHYAGVQLDTYLGVSFVHPGSEPGLFDAAFLRVKLGVRRLRPSADLSVDTTKLVTSDAHIEQARDTIAKTAFDPAAAGLYGAAILPQFSSRPLPRFSTDCDDAGTVCTRLVSDSVGQKGAVDLAFGRYVSNVPMTQMYGGTKLGFATSLDSVSPTGVLILDKLVHRPTIPHMALDFTVNWMYAPPVAPGDPPALPFAERLTRLDAGVDGARTHEVPNYTDMVEYVCGHRGWNVDDFDVYRVRVEYPLHFTRLWTRFVPVPTPID